MILSVYQIGKREMEGTVDDKKILDKTENDLGIEEVIWAHRWQINK